MFIKIPLFLFQFTEEVVIEHPNMCFGVPPVSAPDNGVGRRWRCWVEWGGGGGVG